MFLALKFGYIDPDEMLSEISLDVINEWNAYFTVINSDSGDTFREEQIKKELHGDNTLSINDGLMDKM